MWEWDDEFVLQEDVPKGLWDDIEQNEEHLSYIFDEITPVKACGDLVYHNTNSGGTSSSMKENADNTKEREKCKSNSSQVKRRRMLQFDTEALPNPYCNEEMPPTFLKSKVTAYDVETFRLCPMKTLFTSSLQGRLYLLVVTWWWEQFLQAKSIKHIRLDREDTLEEAFPNMPQWVSGEDTSSSGYEGVDQSSEGWLANCLNDAEMQLISEDADQSGASEVRNSGYVDTLPEHVGRTVQKSLPRSRKSVVFKGKRSYMQTPTKATSSVVYPFAFIKPCAVHGDVTLRDINQRICTPPKPKQDKEDPSAIYPTSAFSGKPVVGQMKIHTEGGKGCITIMRTKG